VIAATLTADQRARERSIATAIVLDVGIVAVMAAVALAGGSFTLLAESIRGGLGVLPECFSYVVLRRIHRGVLEDLDYGTGKLEQVAGLVVGASMLFAAGWIVVGALRIVSGARPVGTPVGLALAAMAGTVNLLINVVAWDGIRRLAAPGDSLIMQTQSTLRWTKLFASAIVTADLTVAALSTDDVIVAGADALGSFLVAGYITVTALQALRGALPDLLDVSAGQAVREGVTRSLSRHAGDYIQMQRVRTRRSSQTAFIEVALEFDAGLSMAEVDRRVEALKATMREEVGPAELSVLASASKRT